MNSQPQILKLINKYLPEASNPIQISEIDLFEAVRQRVKYLLDHDMERLLHMLYRIDVRETLVKEILAVSDPEAVDSELAKAILDRLMQKIRLRAKYGTGN